MKNITRRDLIKSSMAAGLSLTMPFSRVRGANNDIRAAVVGFRGHGRTHINSYLKIPGVRVVALCDADSDILARGVTESRARNQKVDAYTDMRELLEDNSIDVVSTATPNHWHALVTIWACQAGKDVCVEKPVSHNIFEGRKMVEAARKYNRIVQADLDLRSNEGLCEAVRYIQQGQLGNISVVRGFCYKRRSSMGKVSGPQKVPESVDYNLWCGPAPKEPLMRKNLHYDWHWVWSTGCGEIGNNGPHQLDVCRWVLGQSKLPNRVMSIGGRFGYNDDGQTPNTQITIFEYGDIPIIYEVRGLPTKEGDSNMDIYHSISTAGVVMQSGRPSPSPNTGVVVQCEDGYVDLTSLVAFNNVGKEIKRFKSFSPGPQVSFINAVRSRKISDIRTDIFEGHLSTALCHMGNISYRIGKESSNEQIREIIQGDKDSFEAFLRFQKHLSANCVSLKETPPVLGPWLRINSKKERFFGKFSRQANKLLTRDYRKPFIVPEQI
ncbi:MAG: Gfo/Idh/MocA family oxidoreductase [Planctomycetes bacterium]|nr:Gfo/Idh/MocA family oxidoreductase [Planctomycetota bacterium]MBL7145088.1 Gfo/Idh/MocA family oxidoreductase [Phycisphaerae bacterium]